MRRSSITALIAAMIAAAGCIPRPSAGQCEAMVDHIVALTREAHDGRAAEIAGAVSEEHRVSLRERCIDEGTDREVACVLRASSLDAIHECAPRR
ncbi:hypothetical protein ENSA5_69620 [Enhygromyxa salina]|uniref:Lipoprotein n=1 Tax=Enhygromyxa salina TaxID=215803 RepID=A0A2S9XAP2_9BACT|nr:hypothetical protein [Enhygromyxa salina]PRP89925.1 hypothetical protein ENSA5_69620 [Enhygromyxa salina]